MWHEPHVPLIVFIAAPASGQLPAAAAALRFIDASSALFARPAASPVLLLVQYSRTSAKMSASVWASICTASACLSSMLFLRLLEEKETVLIQPTYATISGLGGAAFRPLPRIVSPSMGVSGGAPAFNRSAMVSGCASGTLLRRLGAFAMSVTDHPRLVRASSLAPCSTRYFTSSLSPLYAAPCSAV